MTEEQKKELTTVTGKVYGIVTDVMTKYFDHMPLLMLTKYVATLNQSGNDAYKENKAFPVGFYKAMADLSIDWFMHHFDDLREEDIKPIYIHAWKFHRKYLLKAVDDPENVLDEMLTESEAVLAGYDSADGRIRYIHKIYVYAMRHVEAVIKAEADKERAAEAQAEPEELPAEAMTGTEDPS